METKESKGGTKSNNFVLSRSSNPYRLMVWLAMGGSGIVFIILTIAYAQRSYSPNWNPTPLPGVFFASTAMALAISVALQLAKFYFKREKYETNIRWLFGAFSLGISFILMQIGGWLEWVHQGVFLDNSLQAAFIYLLSGLHLVHALIGVALLGMVLKNAVKNRSYVDSFISSLNPQKNHLFESTILFWHFLDILWLYLFLFFLLV